MKQMSARARLRISQLTRSLSKDECLVQVIRLETEGDTADTLLRAMNALRKARVEIELALNSD